MYTGKITFIIFLNYLEILYIIQNILKCNFYYILNIFTVKELKDICRTNGIGGYSSMSKSVLIEWMMTKDKIMS